MTQSCKPVREHILDFDDDFERTLRRRRNQQESNPPSPEPDLEEQVLEEGEDPTSQEGEQEQGMAMDNRSKAKVCKKKQIGAFWSKRNG
ncbi:hypothetical protein DVH24_039511 [Malus domestica]|uniref:Uncharacterized protein n=1 Tax=Malus domestica TaxID=3750 RepID=A0A498I0P0_MALDO|nr:hypothetical protein DVH24_039511 [Malus domestica]